MNKIVIKVEYWEDDKLLLKDAGAVDITDKTLKEVFKLVVDMFRDNISNVFTEYITK